jgi:hypothetical protein
MTEAVRIEGMESVRALLAALGGTLDEAQRLSQNKMAYEIYAAEKDQMTTDIANPTPWSVGSLRYKKAGTETNFGDVPDVPGAAVYMANAFRAGSRVGPDEWLGVQIMGGQTAGPRRSEKLMQSKGLLPTNKVWVPARGVKLNRYGNIEGGVIARMLMDIQLGFVETKTKNFTLFGPKGNPKGVLTRIGDTWYPFLFFVDRQIYQPRYDFHGRGDREVAAKWRGIWDGYVAKALEKAAS